MYLRLAAADSHVPRFYFTLTFTFTRTGQFAQLLIRLLLRANSLVMELCRQTVKA
jgi:hypothetical protein